LGPGDRGRMVARGACRGGRMAAQPQPKPAAHRRGEMLERLLDRDGPKLRHQARLHSQRPAAAEDALQDACAQFLRYYDGPPEEALRWMYVVVKRCAWAIGRRAGRARETGYELPSEDGTGEEREIVPVDDRPVPAESAERREMTAQRLALLRDLKPDERTALLLLGLGYSYREIGRSRGWSYTKVNRCVAEGRAALRDGFSKTVTNPPTAKGLLHGSVLQPRPRRRDACGRNL
jgi:DNA-directed RNA polymerase specialized sigma24 family protein